MQSYKVKRINIYAIQNSFLARVLKYFSAN